MRGRKDEVDDRRNEAVTQMSAKTKGGQSKRDQTDLTTEIGALSMTSIFVRAGSAGVVFCIQHMVPHINPVNLKDIHAFAIQATIYNHHAAKLYNLRVVPTQTLY